MPISATGMMLAGYSFSDEECGTISKGHISHPILLEIGVLLSLNCNAEALMVSDAGIGLYIPILTVEPFFRNWLRTIWVSKDIACCRQAYLCGTIRQSGCFRLLRR